MVERELIETYEILERKENLHRKSVKFANWLFKTGFITFALTLSGVIPWLFNYAFNAFLKHFSGGFRLSVSLMVIGERLK